MSAKRMELKEFIAARPKIELHLHLEGSLGPEALSGILRYRGAAHSGELGALYGYSDFKGFLKAFGRVNQLLSAPGDFYHVARALSRKLAAQRIIYAEVTYTPLLHTRLGLDHAETMGYILAGLEAERAAGDCPRIAFIYDTVRQWGKEAALESVELARRDKAAGLPVVGFGVGGDELGAPARDLEEAFRLAGESALRKYVHAGEVGGPASVWEAIEVLGAQRIGHGIAAVGDPLLLDELKKRDVALDVCPTSNVRTGAVAGYAEHPLPRLISTGVPVTIGSDDPGFFGAWLEDELRLVVETWNLDQGIVDKLQHAAASHCFLSSAERERLARRLDSPEG